MPYPDELPSKSQIFSYWKDRLSDSGFPIDWGEPSCWACGFHYGTRYDIKRSDAGWNEILKGWESIPLQRCHIVPRSLGGGDEPDNLFLMCRECHDLAPNTSIPSIFFEWARSQSAWKREGDKLEAAFAAFGVGKSEQRELAAILASEEFRRWSSGRAGLHRPQSNYASTTARLTPATMIGLAVQYRRETDDRRAAAPARGLNFDGECRP